MPYVTIVWYKSGSDSNIYSKGTVLSGIPVRIAKTWNTEKQKHLLLLISIIGKENYENGIKESVPLHSIETLINLKTFVRGDFYNLMAVY